MLRTMDAHFKVNGRRAYVVADVDVKTVDDSFSHEFGICHVCHEEVKDIEIIVCVYYDDDSPIDPICPCIKESILQALQDRLN